MGQDFKIVHDVFQFRNYGIKNITHGGNHGGFLYNNQTIVLFGSNSYGQSDINQLNNKNIINFSTGNMHTMIL